MKTFYLMYRGWMDHPVLQEPGKKNLTRREAWCWLIENAAWENQTISWRGSNFKIFRGECPASLRVLSASWGWSINRVQRFIDGLKNSTMADTRTDTGFLIIRICNYEVYQNPKKSTDTDTDTPTDTPTDTIINKGNKNKNIPPTPQGVAEAMQFELVADDQPELDPDRFEEFWDIYPRKIAKKVARGCWDKARHRVPQEVIINAAKRYREAYEADDRPERDRFFKHASGWLNGERWSDYDESDPPPDDESLSETSRLRRAARWVFKNAHEL